MSQWDRYACEHVFQLLDDFVDRELTPEEMQKVQEHLDICAGCASEYAFQANMLQGVREKVQRIAVPETLRDKIAQALQQANAESKNA